MKEKEGLVGGVEGGEGDKTGEKKWNGEEVSSGEISLGEERKR